LAVIFQPYESTLK